MPLNPRFNDKEQPLVSLLIFNYNYGRYLRECFDSALAQTYDNIEILFSDNASTDESWEIALEYQQRYPDIVFVARNRLNFGSDANIMNCFINARGKYFVELCSDDALLPDFTKTCVEALESNTDAAFAMVHRTIIDHHGNHVEEAPFYNETCKIPGDEQAAVYMMAAVNPSVTQIMYRKLMTAGKSIGGFAGRYYTTRIMDFNICCEFPIIYVKEPLMLHRLHLKNDSFNAAANLMEVMGPYMLLFQFVDMASVFNIQKAVNRLPAAIEKNSRLALRYCVRDLISGNERNALRYFHLSAAIFPEIVEDSVYAQLAAYWLADSVEKQRLITGFVAEENFVTRSLSYDPPPGSIPLPLNSRT